MSKTSKILEWPINRGALRYRVLDNNQDNADDYETTKKLLDKKSSGDLLTATAFMNA